MYGTGFQPFEGAAPARGQATFGGRPDNVFARFYVYAKPQPHQSAAEGRPVVKQIEMVEIRQFGERDNILLEVTDEHRMRWDQQYRAFRHGQEQLQNGTQIELLFPGSPEIVAELKACNIHTIEALMEVPDSAQTAKQLPYLTTHKQAARRFLDATSKAASFNAVERELATERAARKALEDRLAALEAGVKEKAA